MITSAAATTPQRMQSPGANIPTAIPTGTDASLTMLTGVSVIHRW